MAAKYPSASFKARGMNVDKARDRSSNAALLSLDHSLWHVCFLQ
jgi:hypothetical protein